MVGHQQTLSRQAGEGFLGLRRLNRGEDARSTEFYRAIVPQRLDG